MSRPPSNRNRNRRFRRRPPRQSGSGGPRQGQQAQGDEGFRSPKDRIQSYQNAEAASGAAAAAKAQPEKFFVNTNPEIATEYLPALFSVYPELIERIPWVSLRGTYQ